MVFALRWEQKGQVSKVILKIPEGIVMAAENLTLNPFGLSSLLYDVSQIEQVFQIYKLKTFAEICLVDAVGFEVFSLLRVRFLQVLKV